MSRFSKAIQWDPAVVDRYDLNGPRYTSYPTAPQFEPGFSRSDWREAMARCRQSDAPVSIYQHIPFCETLCYYCACNKIVTHHKERAIPYLDALEREMAMVAEQLGERRTVAQLHWGGGTPTYISEEQMGWLMEATHRHFEIPRDDSVEASVEVHPGRMAVSKIDCMRQLGFNRLSMGVQDFDPQVQEAVNRYNSVEQVRDVTEAARRAGYKSISMDLMYGLPRQSPESLARTIDEVVALSPDRISAFGYAHMPHLFKSQRLIGSETLPSAPQKLQMLALLIDRLQSAGYVYVGMDHFAKPDDSLVKAQMDGSLYRNFQGYATHKGCELLAFGVSAISFLGGTYIKNNKDIGQYQATVERGEPAFVAGCHQSDEDRLRYEVISELICHFRLSFESISRAFGVEARSHFARELEALRPLEQDGLLSIDDQGIEVHNAGRLLIRRICMAFDQYLASDTGPRYSRVI